MSGLVVDASPGMGGVEQGGSDSFAAMVRVGCDAINHCDVPHDALSALCVSHPAQVLGFMDCRTDKQRAYYSVLFPCPEQLSSEVCVVLPEVWWESHLEWLTDLFGQQVSNGLFFLRGSYRAYFQPGFESKDFQLPSSLAELGYPSIQDVSK